VVHFSGVFPKAFFLKLAQKALKTDPMPKLLLQLDCTCISHAVLLALKGEYENIGAVFAPLLCSLFPKTLGTTRFFDHAAI